MNTRRLSDAMRVGFLICTVFSMVACSKKDTGESNATEATAIYSETETPSPSASAEGRQTRAALPVIIKTKRLCITAKFDISPASVYTIPNKSYGHFDVRATVAYAKTTGFINQQSAGVLQVVETDSGGNGPVFDLAARYNADISGLDGVVTTIFGNEESQVFPFPNVVELDLRIQQTDTQLIFSARPAVAFYGASDWTIVYTYANPVSTNATFVKIGIANINKKGCFYFNGLAADGDGIGGTAEFPILSKMRDAIDQQLTASADLLGATPDFSADSTAVANAIADNQDALNLLAAALSGGTLEPDTEATHAQTLLQQINVSLGKAKTALNLPVQTKAKIHASHTALTATAAKEEVSMVNFLGFKSLGVTTVPPMVQLHPAP